MVDCLQVRIFSSTLASACLGCSRLLRV